jgi:hypothetical protein
MVVELVDDEKRVNLHIITAALSIKGILSLDQMSIVLLTLHHPLAVGLEDGFHEELQDRHLLLRRHVGDSEFDSD